jgi:hypothetical protein
MITRWDKSDGISSGWFFTEFERFCRNLGPSSMFDARFSRRQNQSPTDSTKLAQ